MTKIITNSPNYIKHKDLSNDSFSEAVINQLAKIIINKFNETFETIFKFIWKL